MNERNFSIYSQSAKKIELQFYGAAKPLSRHTLQSGPNWNIELVPPKEAISYSFFVDEKEVLDPYAKQIDTTNIWGVGSSKRALLNDPKPFDWQGVERPKLHLSDLILYEVHVRGFTQDSSSTVQAPGTFAGMREKIPYLVDLGITAVELMPVFEFDESAYSIKNPLDGSQLYNFWGYASCSFFSPMARYAASDDPTTELKELIRELHRNGIEVILDVVYNHSDAFLNIDAKNYYIFDERGNFHNASGCGNTLAANQRPMLDLILASLRYYAREFQVDGFRFDLASALTRDAQGDPMIKPPLIAAIEADSDLQEVKLFAEPWDPGGLYQVGTFPGGDRWSEWNGHYRDVMRRFLKGTDGHLGSFANGFCGSEEIYGKSGSPLRSVNFITTHDGFSLRDLFSYNEKHNLNNGEENLDGSNHNESWNCGEEGPTGNERVLKMRERQIRNAAIILFCSLGVPMLVSGDEHGQTREGNNNPWCQDNKLTHFQWQESDLFPFIKAMIRLRKEHPALRKSTFYTADEVHWHGVLPSQIEWAKEGRFLAVTIKDLSTNQWLYFAFNSFYEPLEITLPEPPEGAKWEPMIQTCSGSKMEEHSVLVLSSKVC